MTRSTNSTDSFDPLALATTLAELFLFRTVSSSKEYHSSKEDYLPREYLLHKEVRGQSYSALTYEEFGEKVRCLAAGLRAMGVQQSDRIAIISESRSEWLVLDFAAILLGAITVPMFPTLTQKQVEYILNDSGARFAAVSNDMQLGKVARSIGSVPALQSILVFNDAILEVSDIVQRSIIHFRQLLSHQPLSRGELSSAVYKSSGEDVVTIIYTSGTTGEPKGVMLTHSNLLANVRGAIAALPPLSDDDLFLSFLPLSHSFERIASYLVFYRGLSIAIAESIDTVADNMLEVRPTIMTGVPRFFERIYSRIMRMRKTLPPGRQRLFDWALKVGSANGRKFEGAPVSIMDRLLYKIADKLVLGKIRDRTGGRIKFFVSGSAALPAEVGRAFAGFGLPILEGYGMTECSPVISVSVLGKIEWGAVGRPLTNITVRIADDGEILIKGPSVMKGYYNAPEATAEIIDAEGWLHTGDVGIWSKGNIKITDRKKHLLVSSGGKNIAPGPIEALLLRSEYIAQVMLIGDKRQFCTALIVPNGETVREYLSKKNVTAASRLIDTPEAGQLIEQELETFQKDVATYERVRRFALIEEPFTEENALLTPTLKIKRKEVECRYEALINSLYSVK